MITPFVIGLLWGITGAHVTAWAIDMRTSRFMRLLPPDCMPEVIAATLCMGLWPLLLVAMLAMKEQPRAR